MHRPMNAMAALAKSLPDGLEIRLLLFSRDQTHVGHQRMSERCHTPNRQRQSYGYSMISSARPSNGIGTAKPRAFAVFRLTTSSTFVACWTGRSDGFSPLRTRPV